MNTGVERFEVYIGNGGFEFDEAKEVAEFGEKIVLELCEFFKGDKGEKGDVPVRGVDYWTKGDIEEFKQHCVNTLEKRWVGPESEYLRMVADGEIEDDWIYYIYDDEEPGDIELDGEVVVEGDTMTVYGGVLSDDGETLTLEGTPSQDSETLTLTGSTQAGQTVAVEGETMTVRGAALSQDGATIELTGAIEDDTLVLEND